MSKLEIIISLIGAIATILAGVWWIVSKIFSKGMDKQHFIEFEKNVNNRFDSVENRLDSLEEKVDNHTLAIVELYSFLGQKYPKHEFMFSKKMSPRMLNELGSKIYGEIDGYDFLSKTKPHCSSISTRNTPGQNMMYRRHHLRPWPQWQTQTHLTRLRTTFTMHRQ